MFTPELSAKLPDKIFKPFIIGNLTRFIDCPFICGTSVANSLVEKLCSL